MVRSGHRRDGLRVGTWRQNAKLRSRRPACWAVEEEVDMPGRGQGDKHAALGHEKGSRLQGAKQGMVIGGGVFYHTPI